LAAQVATLTKGLAALSMRVTALEHAKS
jgi:hypothetical protein